MRLIVGLGNPGEQYAKSRHNVGFMVVDRLSERVESSPVFSHQWSHLRRATIQLQQVLLIQPQTYMNRSGLAVKEVLQRYQGRPEELIIIYDDLDLELGRLRIRTRGGHGGHKGVKSIIERLGTHEFVRLRMGIGRPHSDQSEQQASERAHVVDYVLEPFQDDELQLIEKVITRSVEAVQLIVTGQINMAMNVYNRSEA
jgi:PTH1 family peptidyl-tRNA hydrolase